ncbi:hypothetical protein DOT_1303 [Desulfosporosinus sp. OT]|nr:hypothetical protein DOT_1303 [Desulfosporosinus sp. OT]
MDIQLFSGIPQRNMEYDLVLVVYFQQVFFLDGPLGVLAPAVLLFFRSFRLLNNNN